MTLIFVRHFQHPNRIKWFELKDKKRMSISNLIFNIIGFILGVAMVSLPVAWYLAWMKGII